MKKILLACALVFGVAELGVAQITITPRRIPEKKTEPADEAPVEKADTNPAAAKQGDLLRFRNGDALRGTMLSLTGDTALRWRHPDAKDVIHFDLANILDLQLAPRPPAQPRTPHRTTIELTNGDRLAGDVVSLNDKTLVLNTWYAGSLSIQRTMVQRILPNTGRPDVLYVGPTGLEDWVTAGNRRAWTYRKGTLSGTRAGSIGREMKLPDASNIEFDVAWRGQLYFQMAFYTDDLRQNYGGNSYMLQFNYTNVYLQRMRANQGSSNLGNPVELREFQRKSKAHISVRTNKAKKTIALFVNGNLVKQWTDDGDFAGKGTGMLFYAQGQGVFQISNLTVAEWDGKLDTEAAGTAAVEEDSIRLANNDKVSGQLVGIANNELNFTTSYAPLKIPLERVTLIALASQKSEKARRQTGDVRAFFTDSDRVTLSLEKADERTLVGTSENFGRITGALDAFRRIQFHIYEDRPETGEDDWGTDTGDENADN